MEKSALNLRYAIYSALFTALYIAGTFIRIPIGPVPITLTTLFIFLGALTLPWSWGLSSVALYLLLGVLGLPVFAGGGGPAYFAGPTGGYLAGYLAAMCAVNLISRGGKSRLPFIIVALITGILVVYACGVPWLKTALAISWKKAAILGMLPFIPGDAVKAAAALGIFILLKRVDPNAAYTR